jgi:glycosyltransferase involved in cell wall biosynthesis
MKILFTTFAYYPQTSGVPIVVQYLAEGLSERGHHVCVATRKNGHDFLDVEKINGVYVHRFDIGLTLTKRNTGDIDGFINFVKQYPKDVLVLECLQCHTTDLLLPHLTDLNCRVVVHSHGTPGIRMKMFAWCGDLTHSIGNVVNWFRFRWYYKYTLPRYCKYIDVGVCLSLCSSDMAYFTKHMKKVCIVENAANDLFFEERSYEMDLSPVFELHSVNYVLNISNYSDRKNQLMLIREFEKAGIKDCALVLIGSNKNKYFERSCRAAEQARQRSGCEIYVLADIDRKYFPAIINHASLFVMTSKFEEYPVSLVESMAVGTPFVSTMVGNAHILPGGVVARENGEVSVLLKTLFDNPSILRRLGAQGKQYALRNNTLGSAVDIFEKVLIGD